MSAGTQRASLMGVTSHRRARRLAGLALALAAAFQQPLLAAGRPAGQPTVGSPASAALEAEIRRITARTDGKVGVSVLHLENGARAAVNGGELFPMASTFKIAVAGAILAQVDDGRLRMEQMIAVDPDIVVDSDGIAQNFPHPGIALSVANLIESMLVLSDNTATDVLVRLVGGPAAVTAWLRRIGIQEQRIDRDTAGLIRDFLALPKGFSLKVLGPGVAIPNFLEVAVRPNPAFDSDPRDTSTPDAMVDLLAKIHYGKALSAKSTAVLTAVMVRCKTGLGRLLGMLPPGVVVAHKTGTIGGTVNDVGIVTLPGGNGHVAIAVFVKMSAAPVEEREKLIAHVSRAVYDFMNFHTP